MKKPLIHSGFYREMFRQLRTKGLVATLLLLGLNLILFSIYITRDPIKSTIGHFDARLMAAPMLLILYIFVPIMAFGAYRWLNKRVKSDFYHAIPLTRIQIYATTSAAIFTWLIIALGSYAAVQAILRTAFGLPINYLLFLCVFLNMMLAMIEIVAAFSIGLSLCGRGFTAFFQSVAVLFLPRILLTAFWVLIEIDSGFTLPFSMILPFFNPEYNIAATPIHSLIYGINFANPFAMLWSLVYGAGLFVLGGVAFKKRRSELAEIPYASKVLQTATRVMFGMPQLIAITVLLNVHLRYGESWAFLSRAILIPLVLTSVLFSFIFYCLYELISSRKMEAVVKAMPGYALCLALSVFFILVPYAIGSLRTLKPIAAEEIQSFRISNESTIIFPSGVSKSETWADYVLYRHTFSDSSANSLIASQSKKDCKTQTNDTINFTDTERIIVNDGGLFRKMVSVTGRTYLNQQMDLDTICRSDSSYMEKVLAFPKGQITYYAEGLTLSEAKTVGRLFREDYEALSPEERLSLFVSYDLVIEDEDGAADPIGLAIKLYGSYGAENYCAYYRIGKLTPNASKAILGFLNARNAEKVRTELKALVKWMEQPNKASYPSDFYIGTRSIDQYTLWSREDRKTYATPKEAHPDAYTILKALSEAPLSDDPSCCVTVSLVGYNTRDFEALLQSTAVGIAVDEPLRSYIEKWIAAYDSIEDVPVENVDM